MSNDNRIRLFGALEEARLATASIEELVDIEDPVNEHFDTFQAGVEHAQKQLMDAWGRLYHMAKELREC